MLVFAFKIFRLNAAEQLVVDTKEKSVAEIERYFDNYVIRCLSILCNVSNIKDL